MLDLANVCKTYGSGDNAVEVLINVCLRINRGEFVSIMGPSGSGKSTLASILGCLASPSSGTYEIEGQGVSALSGDDLAQVRNRKLGFIFQESHLLEGLDAVDNVALPLAYGGVRSRERRARAIRCLEKVGLGDRLGHLPGQLSGGQKQRVAIARALINDPSILLADEPTGALDHRTSLEIIDLMQSLNVAGHTIVQVTHSEEEAQFSQRIVTMVDGQIVKDQVVDNVKTVAYELHSASGADVESKIWGVIRYAKTSVKVDLDSVHKMIEGTTSRGGMMAACRALAETGQLHRVLDAERWLQSSEWAVRAEWIQSADASQEECWSMLDKTLTDENSWVRFLSFAKLKCLPSHVQPRFRELCLRAMLDDKDERVRATAVTFVARCGEGDVVGSLLDVLKDDLDPRVRTNAVEGVAELLTADAWERIPTLRPILEEALVDPHHRVSTTAAVVLWPVAEDAVSSLFEVFLREGTAVKRAATAWAISQIDERERFRDLLGDILCEEQDPMALRQISRALASIADASKTLAPEIELAKPDSSQGRDAA